MARQTLTPISVGSRYPTGLTALTLTAADPTNKEQFLLTERDVLLIFNSHASTAYTVTIDSVADPITSRTGSLSAISVPAQGLRCVGPLGLDGWKNSSGYLTFEAENAAIKYCVLRGVR
jgi:hypothetical protein